MTVLRFRNEDILNNLESVLTKIAAENGGVFKKVSEQEVQ